jgi:hypothetical protein
VDYTTAQSRSGGLARLAAMAEAAQTENVSARLAQVRDGLKLLADYL